MTFKDYFSGHATDYASYRPHYPATLFDWLTGQAPDHGRALDCACGNGQAARALADHFRHVIATDASRPQLQAAQAHPRVDYVCARAEQTPLPDAGLDLLAVAQAAHWFDLPAFYAEAARVLRPGGLLAVWGYGLTRITPAIDAVIDDYYSNLLHDYWPPERRHLEQAYQTLVFPWPELDSPDLIMTADWTLTRLLGYLATWSATRLYIKETGHDPLPALAQRLQTEWGDADAARTVTWPLFLRAGHRP
jgi:SAM-dependent methyltransferase